MSVNTISQEALFVRAYHFSYFQAAKVLLKGLETKLSEADQALLEECQKLTELEFTSASARVIGGCPEAREAERQASILRKAIEDKCALSEISDSRRRAFLNLPVAGHEGYYRLFPPKVVGDILYHMGRLTRNQVLSHFKEMAILVGAPSDIVDYYDLMLTMAQSLESQSETHLTEYYGAIIVVAQRLGMKESS